MINIQKYQAVIFDLDGTLVDSLEDIADAMNQTLLRFDYPIHSYESYKYFVGNGLKNLVYQCIPIERRNELHVLECLDVMMEEYRKNYVSKTKLYDGIDDLLTFLKKQGFKLAILSNKVDELTQKIYKKLLYSWQFDFILGATDQFPRKPDPESALYIAKEINILPENILYIGDTGVDMQTARTAGMFSIGVTWGFRQRQELEENGAQLIINNPGELEKYLINK